MPEPAAQAEQAEETSAFFAVCLLEERVLNRAVREGAAIAVTALQETLATPAQQEIRALLQRDYVGHFPVAPEVTQVRVVLAGLEAILGGKAMQEDLILAMVLFIMEMQIMQELPGADLVPPAVLRLHIDR